ncbi:MBL fold metallo-hydrolase [Myceligenerans xiligouense]|uniref:Glyoxylase-like metal-dependent hydrolase (Beta-lactamase superfamily II) n=1 Tax=Myceligenerans xiligouense TaxID=253184 RepID=A0A3N4YLE2_9MICO|nr:MBL fold metallo-hydrolase [Myceligenerans xiligouense]RPF20927.1 glyoxylase-like metal-dependent hydrolase (beta-lactamase superfamily II) [Myceligenerans xiligouense]
MSVAAQVDVVVAPVFGTNCCVVAAPGSGVRDCVVVDAGAGVADGVARVVEERRLRPRAVLATHGHADHTWDAAELCERYDVPMWMHAADVYRLDDPFGTLVSGAGAAAVSSALGRELAALGFAPEAYRAPKPVEGFETRGGSADLTFGAVTLRAVHAPGHTQGSTLYLLDPPGSDGGAAGRGGTGEDARTGGRTTTGAEADAATPDSAPSGIVLTGDVLFAGSIGRTDLPGGDDATMRATLSDVVARLDPGLAVVPGHGPTTTVERELATNPYLR